MRGGRKLALYLLHDVFIDNCLRRLAGDAAGNLRQITATHIQLVGIEMHIAIGAAEVIHLRDKLVVKLGTPALQITLPSQFYIDEILRHRQRLLHLLALVQIDGKSRREAIDETMRIGIIKAIDPESLLLGKAQQSGVPRMMSLSFFLATTTEQRGSKRYLIWLTTSSVISASPWLDQMEGA